jgi:nucleoside-diphosphate-sugar epimerase
MADNIAIVAGAGGFIGRHLVRYLLDMKMEVIGLGRRPVATELIRPNEHYEVVDLTDRQAVLELLNGVRARWAFNLTGIVDHTVLWPDQREIIDQHLLSVLNLVEAFHDHPPEAFVNIGSSDEYGDQPAPQHEEMRESPIAPYSAAKTAATHYLQMLHRRIGFPAVIARFFLVYGPGQDTQRLIPQACVRLLRGDRMEASLGTQKRDFLYIDDAITALVALASTAATRGKVFNVASGKGVCVRQVLDTIQSLAQCGTIDFGARSMRPGEIMELYADITRIKQFTQWEPRVDLEDGLRRTVDFYREDLKER